MCAFRKQRPRPRTPEVGDEQLAASIAAAAQPLIDAGSLDPLIDAVGDARYVLLGEASHGTSEFYGWRTEISRRLITEKGFAFIAVEGDWPDCYRVNRYVKAYESAGASARDVLHAFERWPTWMWANHEIVELVAWLRAHNDARPPDERVGFYGLDVYSLWESMASVVSYLDTVDPALARNAKRAYACFEPYQEDVQQYARATALVPTSCEAEAVETLRTLRLEARAYEASDPEAYFNAEQNALVARNAELYYRTMVRGGPESWNIRDRHMFETLTRLVRHHGPRAKAIVWEHNTHIGDARFTDMARAGMLNVGQLVRQAHAEDGVWLIGFGTNRGTVIAAEEWGDTMRRMNVPEARDGSYEHLMHRASLGAPATDYGLRVTDRALGGLDVPRGHRAIGVVYDPRTEHWGNYVPTILTGRYDYFLFLDETHAVAPLHMPAHADGEPPETWPSGF